MHFEHHTDKSINVALTSDTPQKSGIASLPTRQNRTKLATIKHGTQQQTTCTNTPKRTVTWRRFVQAPQLRQKQQTRYATTPVPTSPLRGFIHDHTTTNTAPTHISYHHEHQRTKRQVNVTRDYDRTKPEQNTTEATTSTTTANAGR